MENSAQQNQPAAQQINPNSLINAISAQRDQALNALALTEAQRTDMGQAIQQAAAELEVLKGLIAEKDGLIEELKAQLAKLSALAAAPTAVDAAA